MKRFNPNIYSLFLTNNFLFVNSWSPWSFFELLKLVAIDDFPLDYHVPCRSLSVNLPVLVHVAAQLPMLGEKVYSVVRSVKFTKFFRTCRIVLVLLYDATLLSTVVGKVHSVMCSIKLKIILYLQYSIVSIQYKTVQ